MSQSLAAGARTRAPVFAALGDPTRLRLVARLAAGPALSITELTAGEDVTRQAITKHLGVLTRAGLVRATKHGREQRYALHPAPLVSASAFLAAVSSRWDAALARLAHLVED